MNKIEKIAMEDMTNELKELTGKISQLVDEIKTDRKISTEKTTTVFSDENIDTTSYLIDNEETDDNHDLNYRYKSILADYLNKIYENDYPCTLDLSLEMYLKLYNEDYISKDVVDYFVYDVSESNIDNKHCKVDINNMDESLMLLCVSLIKNVNIKLFGKNRNNTISIIAQLYNEFDDEDSSYYISTKDIRKLYEDGIISYPEFDYIVTFKYIAD